MSESAGDVVEKKIIGLLLIAVVIVSVLLCFWWLKQEEMYSHATYGTVVARYRNSFVVQGDDLNAGYSEQAFYVFMIDANTSIQDRSGAEIPAAEIREGDEVVVWNYAHYRELGRRTDISCYEVIKETQ